MLRCPQCKAQIDYGNDIEVGQELTCSICGAHLEVVGTDPVELESVEEVEEHDLDEEPGEDSDSEEDSKSQGAICGDKVWIV